MADNKYSGGIQFTAIPATPSGERPPVRGYPLVLYGVPMGIVRASHHHCDSRIPRGSHRPRSSSRPRPATPCSTWLTRPWDSCSARCGSSKESSITAPASPAKRCCAFEYDIPSAPACGLWEHVHWHARSPQSLRAKSHNPGPALSRTRESIVTAHSHRGLFIVFNGLLLAIKKHLVSNR